MRIGIGYSVERGFDTEIGIETSEGLDRLGLRLLRVYSTSTSTRPGANTELLATVIHFEH